MLQRADKSEEKGKVKLEGLLGIELILVWVVCLIEVCLSSIMMLMMSCSAYQSDSVNLLNTYNTDTSDMLVCNEAKRWWNVGFRICYIRCLIWIYKDDIFQLMLCLKLWRQNYTANQIALRGFNLFAWCKNLLWILHKTDVIWRAGHDDLVLLVRSSFRVDTEGQHHTIITLIQIVDTCISVWAQINKLTITCKRDRSVYSVPLELRKIIRDSSNKNKTCYPWRIIICCHCHLSGGSL